MNSICDRCGVPIEDDEVQMCERDGLGNCCISPLDHNCEGPEKGTRVRVDFDMPGGKVTGMEGNFILAKGGEAFVETHLGAVAGPLETLEVVQGHEDGDV